MLSENQIKRVLKICVKQRAADNSCKNKDGDKTLMGWVQALRLVLERDTNPNVDLFFNDNLISDIDRDVSAEIQIMKEKRKKNDI